MKSVFQGAVIGQELLEVHGRQLGDHGAEDLHLHGGSAITPTARWEGDEDTAGLSSLTTIFLLDIYIYDICI